MKLIAIVSIVGSVFLGLTGCDIQQTNSNATTQIVAENEKNEIKILEVGIDLKEPGKKGANYKNYLQEDAKGGLDAGTKNSFNINLKEGQYFKIETDTNYPITIMLKDNSTEEYVYNDTKIPEENIILTDTIDKNDNYELMIDFNEIEVFNFDVFIINK